MGRAGRHGSRVLRRFANGRVRVEFTPAPHVAGTVLGRPGTPARTEAMTVEAWQIVPEETSAQG